MIGQLSAGRGTMRTLAHAGAAAQRDGVLLIGSFLSAIGGVRAPGEELAVRLGRAGYAVLTASRRRSRAFRLLDMIGTVIRAKRRYAVAHIEVYSGLAFCYAEAVCATLRTMGKPYALTLHGGELPSFSRRWPRRVTRLLRSAGAVTAPSGYLLEGMRPYRSDLRLLPNAIEVGAHAFHLRDRPQPRLVWLRAFHRRYNPGLAVAVVSRLKDAFPDIQLTMIGPDKGDGSLSLTRRAATALVVADRVSFPGTIPKSAVPAWLEGADIFLNSTNVDNTPVSVLEAMACGLCIVSTRVGGIPYLLEDGEDALLVPPNDPDAMAEAVKRILTEPGLGARLSRNARAKAGQFDWRVILPRWETLLAEVGQT